MVFSLSEPNFSPQAKAIALTNEPPHTQSQSTIQSPVQVPEPQHHQDHHRDRPPKATMYLALHLGADIGNHKNATKGEKRMREKTKQSKTRQASNFLLKTSLQTNPKYV